VAVPAVSSSAPAPVTAGGPDDPAAAANPPAQTATQPGGQPAAPSQLPGTAPPNAAAVPPVGGVTPTEPIAATADEPIAMSILAREECWLSLSIDGQKVIGRNLQPGERVQYRAKRTADVSLGNAGAIDLVINGKPAKPLGGRGQVVTKTITVDTIKSLIQ
jgi:cytoskeleton protein RodZ